MTKIFRGRIDVEFEVDKVSSPLELGAKIEKALSQGCADLKISLGRDARVTAECGFTHVRPPKAAPAPAPQAPRADDGQTDIEDAINKAKQPEAATA